MIVDAAFGFFGGMVKTSQDQLWAIGYPHPVGVWTAVHNKGAMSGRIADSIASLPQGGNLVASSAFRFG